MLDARPSLSPFDWQESATSSSSAKTKTKAEIARSFIIYRVYSSLYTS